MAITIKDVAHKAGVSISTVSKVMNHSPSIPDRTADRIFAIMEELHYQPNAQARSFATQTTKSIVFLAKLEDHTAFDNPHMFEIMCGVQETLAKKNYTLRFESVRNAVEAAPLIERIATQRAADGVVVHGSATTRELTSFLVKSEFPHIVIGKPPFESRVCWIDTNNHLSGQLAAEHLYTCGYRKIAFVGGEEGDGISGQRLSGFLSAMEEQRLSVPEGFIKRGKSTKESGFEMALSLFQSSDLPQAVICESNSIALGVVKAASAAMLRIPEDIAVVCFDDFPLSRLIDPAPTVVDINVYDMGTQATAMLLRKIRNPSLQVQSYTTLPTLIVRKSTKTHVNDD